MKMIEFLSKIIKSIINFVKKPSFFKRYFRKKDFLFKVNNYFRLIGKKDFEYSVYRKQIRELVNESFCYEINGEDFKKMEKIIDLYNKKEKGIKNAWLHIND